MKNLLTTLLVGATATASASAAEIFVTANISTSTTWTADNVYNLQQQIYVLPGATLTIEPGTRIASTAGLGGSLAVARGAQIFALGENGAPIVFTSTADNGTWREAANEWGNLTIMGSGYVSENAIPTNSAVPSASNFANMEGLQPPAGSTIGQYGGGNDNDDSGTIRYTSFRFGGRVIGLGNELNGLSLGGIGRGTDIHHIEIMNNVDDGIEIWGGTVNLKYFSIWNIGDDSLDVDQGWRGKAQFGLIVQGYSLDASQGSGVGDNAIEMDGAEDSNWQPVTTASIRNMTVIGQPLDGDGLTAWRDGARVQFHNSIFMDGGEQVVRPDGDDGDGASGYGFGGTLTFAQVWNTPYTSLSTVNAPANQAAFYQSQVSGNLAEIKSSVFYRNLASNAYTEANARGVFAAANNNIQTTSFPIASITRLAPVVKGGKQMLQVVGLDPTPINAALTAGTNAPNDGFFSPATYRGAFSPATQNNWLAGWSASAEFGFITGDDIGTSYCQANANSTGVAAEIRAAGSTSVAANNVTLEASGIRPLSFGFFVTSLGQGFVANPAGSAGNLCLSGAIGRYVGGGQIQQADLNGVFSLGINLASIPQPLGAVSATAGQVWNFQAWFRDSVGGQAVSNFTNGVSIEFN
ncbi:hypothetical protein Poly30_07210 [Planctomycetes bacterium Poly30]|uniref:Right handed beta helix domain-containing protein n=1 Tax=Saltatorellus ferox TaxID=2528018 RepID=A0A518EMB0_9BACT|nr:hypothetical protein Poly30_07210 [Planctomycetes bacterium Poly30]